MVNEISSLADIILALLKKKTILELGDLIVEVKKIDENADEKDVWHILDVLEREGFIDIKYNMTKIYIIWLEEPTAVNGRSKRFGEMFELTHQPPHQNKRFETFEKNRTLSYSRSESTDTESTTVKSIPTDETHRLYAELRTNDMNTKFDEIVNKEVTGKKEESKKGSFNEEYRRDHPSKGSEIEELEQKVYSLTRKVNKEEKKQKEEDGKEKKSHRSEDKADKNKDMNISKDTTNDKKMSVTEKTTVSTAVAPSVTTSLTTDNSIDKKGSVDECDSGYPRLDYPSLDKNDSNNSDKNNSDDNNNNKSDNNKYVPYAIFSILIIGVLIVLTSVGFSPFSIIGSLSSSLFSGPSETTSVIQQQSKDVTISPIDGVNSHSQDKNIISPKPLTAEIQLEVSEDGYTPDIIDIANETTISIFVLNKGIYPHSFVLDEFGINLMIMPNKKENVTFTVNKSGTFAFYSNVSYYDPIFNMPKYDNLKGKLIVR